MHASGEARRAHNLARAAAALVAGSTVSPAVLKVPAYPCAITAAKLHCVWVIVCQSHPSYITQAPLPERLQPSSGSQEGHLSIPTQHHPCEPAMPCRAMMASAWQHAWASHSPCDS